MQGMKIDPSVISKLLDKKVYHTGDASARFLEVQAPQIKLVICFFNSEFSNLPESSAQFLGNILKAVELDFDSVFMLNVAEKNVGLSNLTQTIEANKLICFGITPAQIHLNIEHILYKVIHLSGVAMLFADQLENIERDVAKKKMLWGELQKMFKKSV